MQIPEYLGLKEILGIVRHHLDWIKYHTYKIAEEIERNGGNRYNFMIVTQPGLFIAKEGISPEMRDLVITPESAGWEYPPLPNLILSRLKREPQTE
jgi:hypothetical protein